MQILHNCELFVTIALHFCESWIIIVSWGDEMTVGERIKERRIQLGMSAEALASKVGMSPATIYRYENGFISSANSNKLNPIAAALQTTPSYLMGWDEEPMTDAEREMWDIRNEFEKNPKALNFYRLFQLLDESTQDQVIQYMQFLGLKASPKQDPDHHD